MNVRLGMARVARFTAVAYWAICLVILGAAFKEGMETYYPSSEPYAYGSNVWEWSNLGYALGSSGTVLGWEIGVYLTFWAIFRGLRWTALGFMDRPEGKDTR